MNAESDEFFMVAQLGVFPEGRTPPTLCYLSYFWFLLSLYLIIHGFAPQVPPHLYIPLGTKWRAFKALPHQVEGRQRRILHLMRW